MTRYLCDAGLNVTLIAPWIEEGALRLPDGGRELSFSDSVLRKIDESYDAVVVQGHLAREVIPKVRSTPLVVDLYDPFLLSNIAYSDTLGGEVFESDLALLQDACSHGDFFMCAGERQRDYYLGCLSALGRVNPALMAADPDARGLIDLVPFGVPDPLPVHRPYLPPAEPAIRRILFGGLYDWYDPWSVIHALKQPALTNCHLLFVRNPNLESTPQRLFGEIETWRRDNPWAQERIEFINWVPWNRRFDLLRDIDLLVAAHPDTVESRFSMRTRFLEAIAAGCPVVATAGGTSAELVLKYNAGAVVEPGNSDAIVEKIAGILACDRPAGGRPRAAGSQFIEDYRWSRVLAPLVRFCRKPRTDPFKPPRTPNHFHAPGATRRSGSKAPPFSVAIPTFNRMDALPGVIAALAKQQRAPKFELVIVDDGSNDGTMEWLQKQVFPFPVQLIRQENSGPGAARNTALKASKYDYIAFLGDDIVPERLWLSAHARRHARHDYDPNIVVIGHTDWHGNVRHTRFRDFLDETGWQFGYDRINDPDDIPFNFLYSSNMSMSRDRLLRDPFHPTLRPWEDTELGYRLKSQGTRLIYEPAARAAHLHQPGVARMAARHRKTGYAAMEFSRLHPELESFLLPTDERMNAASGPIVRTMRTWFAVALEYLPVSMPRTWDDILRDQYAAGIRDYDRHHGVKDGSEMRVPRIFPVVFQANSALLGHETGESRGQEWICLPDEHMAGYCIFGPGFRVYDKDTMEVKFVLRCTIDEPRPRSALTLEVYDQRSASIIEAAGVKETGSTGADSSATLAFSCEAGQSLEFRVFWHGNCLLEMIRIELHRASGESR